MNTKNFVVLLVVGILITAACGAGIYFFLYQKNKKLSKDFSSKKSKLAELQKKFNEMTFLEKRVAELTEENKKFSNILPSKKESKEDPKEGRTELEWRYIIENEFREKANNISFLSIKPIEEKRVRRRRGAKPATTATNIEKFTYEYAVRGKHSDVCTFISLIESSDWFMKIEKLRLIRKEEDVEREKGVKEKMLLADCTLTISGYFFKE